MKIVMTGGGSGGHITPILAVAHEVKILDPDGVIFYIGQKGDGLADIPASDPNITDVFVVSAGKFRRYHGQGIKQLFDIKTMALNVRDLFRIVAGIWQSWRLLGKLRPDIIFTRGGYVSVPVALAGKLRGIPYITHDSDSIPSLANRIIARWARLHAVALPKDVYPYPAAKTTTVGVPVSSAYHPVSASQRAAIMKELRFSGLYEQVLLVTGGGNGAGGLNEVIVANSAFLLKKFPKLVVVHVAGRSLEKSTAAAYKTVLSAEHAGRVIVKGFTTDLHKYSAVANVVIARGGATNLAEFALQAKACLIIPSPQLVWNIKNTQTLADRGALLSLTQVQAEQELRVANTISDLLLDEKKQQALGAKLAKFAHPHAARELAMVLLNQ